jgi:transcriptional regulator of met regulon
MPKASTLRSYPAEFVVVFVGVALAFAVDNLREARNGRAIGDQYLSAFRQDLTADLKMIQDRQDARQAQLANARILPQRAELQVQQLRQQIPAG